MRPTRLSVDSWAGGLNPLYPSTKGLASWTIARCVRMVLDQLDAGDLREPEAAPFAALRQAGSAAAADLVGERFLLALGMAKDDRAHDAAVATVDALDLLLAGDRLCKKEVGATGHAIPRDGRVES